MDRQGYLSGRTMYVTNPGQQNVQVEFRSERVDLPADATVSLNGVG